MNHRDIYGQTPIYYSAREGHYELTQKLIEHGANVNNEDVNGQTPLFYSAREGHKEISELLIKNDAIPNKKDKKRQTPMYWAKKSNRTEVESRLRLGNRNIISIRNSATKTTNRESKSR